MWLACCQASIAAVLIDGKNQRLSTKMGNIFSGVDVRSFGLSMNYFRVNN
jgi:hypothetical protein